MVRGPRSGNGTRSPVYFHPPGAGMLPDGSLAAEPGLSGIWWGAGGRWLHSPLGVPVAATGQGDGMVVSGEPAWLPAPPQIPPPAAPRGTDRVAQSQLMNELPAFFQAYASGDSAELNRFLVRGVPVTGLGGAVAFDSITALHVPPGGASRQITVTVIWQLSEQPGSAAGNLGMTPKLEMTYGMSVVDLHYGKWYVKEIGASTEAVGAR
jgi:Conjugative transposon protein TcpC